MGLDCWCGRFHFIAGCANTRWTESRLSACYNRSNNRRRLRIKNFQSFKIMKHSSIECFYFYWTDFLKITYCQIRLYRAGTLVPLFIGKSLFIRSSFYPVLNSFQMIFTYNNNIFFRRSCYIQQATDYRNQHYKKPQWKHNHLFAL
jgi:hypothetical protein